METLALEIKLEEARRATAAAAARPAQSDAQIDATCEVADAQTDAWQFDNPQMAQNIEDLKNQIRGLETVIMQRKEQSDREQSEVAANHPITAYEAKMSLAITLDQTIQKQREIVDAEILEHGAHLDDEDVGSVAVLKDQADCMQVLASKAQDLFFYFQNIWLLCLMRLMCLM